VLLLLRMERLHAQLNGRARTRHRVYTMLSLRKSTW
jgi:hypothetical protein